MGIPFHMIRIDGAKLGLAYFFRRTAVKFPVYYRVSVCGQKRFESVFLEQAKEFATQLYQKERVIADIDELSTES